MVLFARDCHELFYFPGLSAPEKLTVDWITGNIYFIDRHKKQISVCTPNGSYCTVLISSPTIDMPGGLVLNPKGGDMFWSDYGKAPSIWTAGMDGRNSIAIVKEGLGWPKDLAIDYSTQSLYWINSLKNSIGSVRFDGTNRKNLIQMEDTHLRSLAIFNGRLYWSSWFTKKISSMNLASSPDERILTNASDLIYNMEIYHPSLKSRFMNPCTTQTCSELCLLTYNRVSSCACSLGRVLNRDLRSCNSGGQSSHLVIAAGNKILYYHGEMLGKARIKGTTISIRIGRIAYNSHTGNFIADDQYTNALHSVNPRNNEVRLLADPVYSQHLGGIDVNLRNNMTSWSNTHIRRIEEISLLNGAKWFYNFEDVPLSILSVPKHKKRIVAFKSDTTGYRIDWLFFREPRYPKTIISNLIGPTISLALNGRTERVYFADEGAGKIESFSVNAECSKRRTDCDIDRRLVCSGIEKPVSLAIVHDKVYWTIRGSNVLQWVDLGDEYQAIKSTVLPIKNDLEIMDIVAVEGIGHTH